MHVLRQRTFTEQRMASSGVKAGGLTPSTHHRRHSAHACQKGGLSASNSSTRATWCAAVTGQLECWVDIGSHVLDGFREASDNRANAASVWCQTRSQKPRPWARALEPASFKWCPATCSCQSILIMSSPHSRTSFSSYLEPDVTAVCRMLASSNQRRAACTSCMHLSTVSGP